MGYKNYNVSGDKWLVGFNYRLNNEPEKIYKLSPSLGFKDGIVTSCFVKNNDIYAAIHIDTATIKNGTESYKIIKNGEEIFSNKIVNESNALKHFYARNIFISDKNIYWNQREDVRYRDGIIKNKTTPIIYQDTERVNSIFVVDK